MGPSKLIPTKSATSLVKAALLFVPLPKKPVLPSISTTTVPLRFTAMAMHWLPRWSEFRPLRLKPRLVKSTTARSFALLTSVRLLTAYLQEGQEVKVKCMDIDNRGRIKLSIKELLDK